MFDFGRVQLLIQEHYYRLFRGCEKPEETGYFIKRWLDLVRSHSTSPDFLSFDPTIPVLTRLVPKANTLIVVPFPNVKVGWGLPRTSVFPYFPFRIRKENNDVVCRAGLEFLHLYLELTGIRVVCLYRLYRGQEDRIADELQQKHPGLKVYGKGSYDSFKRIAVVMASNSGTGSSKFRPRSSALRDKVSR